MWIYVSPKKNREKNGHVTFTLLIVGRIVNDTQPRFIIIIIIIFLLCFEYHMYIYISDIIEIFLCITFEIYFKMNSTRYTIHYSTAYIVILS